MDQPADLMMPALEAKVSRVLKRNFSAATADKIGDVAQAARLYKGHIHTQEVYHAFLPKARKRAWTDPWAYQDSHQRVLDELVRPLGENPQAPNLKLHDGTRLCASFLARWMPRLSKLWRHKRFDGLAPMMQKTDLHKTDAVKGQDRQIFLPCPGA